MTLLDRTPEQRRAHASNVERARLTLARMADARAWESVAPGGILDADTPLACTARSSNRTRREN